MRWVSWSGSRRLFSEVCFFFIGIRLIFMASCFMSSRDIREQTCWDGIEQILGDLESFFVGRGVWFLEICRAVQGRVFQGVASMRFLESRVYCVVKLLSRYLLLKRVSWSFGFRFLQLYGRLSQGVCWGGGQVNSFFFDVLFQSRRSGFFSARWEAVRQLWRRQLLFRAFVSFVR